MQQAQARYLTEGLAFVILDNTIDCINLDMSKTIVQKSIKSVQTSSRCYYFEPLLSSFT
jgi:hypothetical protein